MLVSLSSESVASVPCKAIGEGDGKKIDKFRTKQCCQSLENSQLDFATIS